MVVHYLNLIDHDGAYYYDQLGALYVLSIYTPSIYFSILFICNKCEHSGRYHNHWSNDSPSEVLDTNDRVHVYFCTALAVIGAVLLLLCVLRRRQKQQDDQSGDMRGRISRIIQDFTIPPASSPQPLISPTQSYTNDRPPLTPPLRLRDRKLLPSLLRPLSRSESTVFGPPFDTHHSNRSSSSHYSIHSQKKTKEAGGGSFPVSPICSPTYEPRQEKTYHKIPSSLINSPASLSPEPSSPPYTRLKSPPPVAFTFPPRYSPDSLHHHQCAGSPPRKGPSSSLRRAVTSATSTSSSDYNQDYYANSRRTNSTDTATTVVAAPLPPPPPPQQQEQHYPTAISSNPFAPTPPSSPTRPRRPHDEPLEIPDLVSPLTSMTSPASPSPGPPPNKALPPPPGSRRTSSVVSEIGMASTTANTTSGTSLRSLQGQEGQQHQGGPPGPGEGRGGRRSRDSWGSWGDTAGDRSIVGVALSPSGSLSLPGRGAGTVYPYP
ncbi:hypothetical protein VMCG_07426 [Cytospora schulzeri]|uniref:Uncharacterized protein n=1 Tax=Cytospora schulzeri TaxID=448051 RepID=A0A423W2Z2_9PEZI|nr:hypothetical protein VMCG_07426 [Valsa malicola]